VDEQKTEMKHFVGSKPVLAIIVSIIVSAAVNWVSYIDGYPLRLNWMRLTQLADYVAPLKPDFNVFNFEE
jgi:hypothetical protein